MSQVSESSGLGKTNFPVSPLREVSLDLSLHVWLATSTAPQDATQATHLDCTSGWHT
jgi:hypothetical protein